jgi:hypothetical protein
MLPKTGESRANALMKGTTKAKRRVTLSICGLGGMPDESELDGMPGAKTFDAEDEAPVAPIHDATAPEKRTWAQWKDALEIACREAQTPEERGRLISRSEVVEIVRLARLGPYSPAKARIIELYEEAERRYLADPLVPPEPEADELPEVEIAGEDKVMSGYD